MTKANPRFRDRTEERVFLSLTISSTPRGQYSGIEVCSQVPGRPSFDSNLWPSPWGVPSEEQLIDIIAYVDKVVSDAITLWTGVQTVLPPR